MKLRKIFETADVETEDGTILGKPLYLFVDKDSRDPRRFDTVVTRDMKNVWQFFSIDDLPKITSLKHTPKTCEGDFELENLPNLESLEHGPTTVMGSYDIENCPKIKNLVGMPDEVYASRVFNCDSLESTKGAPKRVDGTFSLINCKNLKSLDDMPSHIGRHIQISDCKNIDNFHDIHKKIKHIGGNFYISACYTKSHILGFMLIDGLREIKLVYEDVMIPEIRGVVSIMNRYLADYPLSKQRMIDCQNSLIDDGYDDYAQL